MEAERSGTRAQQAHEEARTRLAIGIQQDFGTKPVQAKRPQP